MRARTVPDTEFTVRWDYTKPREIEEAKDYYLEARKLGRPIFNLDKKVVDLWDPNLEGIVVGTEQLNDSLVMHIFDETGDRRLIWNPRFVSQVQEAAELFDSYMAKGYKAYAVNEAGQRGRRIFAFNPKLEEIYFDEKKTIAMTIKEFAKSFQRVTVLPKTYPG